MLNARRASGLIPAIILFASCSALADTKPASGTLDVLKAASEAAQAAVSAANAAADAAKAAATAASAAASAAADAMKSAQEAPPALPPSGAPLSAGKPSDIPTPAPIGLQSLDIAMPAHVDARALAKDFDLHKLFGVRLIPVAVATQMRQLGTGEDDHLSAESPQRVDSLDLLSSTQAAMTFSREVHVADARLAQAEAQSHQARAFLLPSLSLRVARGRETSSPSSVTDTVTGEPIEKSVHTRTDKALTLRQPLLDMPSMLDWRRREKLVDSRTETRRGTQGDAWLATVDAYLALTSSRLIADLALGYEKQLDQLFSYVDKRATVGASSHADRERVRARMLSAQASRSQQESAHAAAAVEFLRLTNLAPQQIQLPDRQDLGAIPASVEEAVQVAMDKSPDVAALKLEIGAAELERNAARSKFLPRFDLELSRMSTENAGGPSGLQEDTRMMLVMNWNLLNGGADMHLGKEKVARIEEARYRLDDQQRKITQAMMAQYATLDSTREQLVSAYRELEAISTAAKAMSERMFAGNQSLLDLLDVQDRLYQARTRLVVLHTQEMSSIGQITRMLGTSGLPGDAEPLAASLAETHESMLPGGASAKIVNNNVPLPTQQADLE